ncbi:MAG: hypothetical protein JXA57_10180 [Armatimonadetes bacterium]|nr:hypothetical protein [Armatimonadota bacterium]
MTRLNLLFVILISLLASQFMGCGRPSLPGRQFEGDEATLGGQTEADTPLPEQPMLEWGPKDAKVQVVAFYPIDEPHQRLIDTLKELATERYPGQIRVRYVDYRTPEGRQLFLRTELQVATILINGESSVELQSEKGVRTVDFVRDMGRYWTEKDLRQAVGDAVERSTESP